MKVTFYGVRGSMPTPAADKLVFGGNTSCVAINNCQNEQLILDAGTGIVGLGDKRLLDENDINLLLTHNHWDHIQGFPFFKPIYQANRTINIYVGAVESDDRDAILQQMTGSTHPVKFHQLPANINLHHPNPLKPTFTIGSYTITRAPLNHPDGGSGYAIASDGCKVCYITDNELLPPAAVRTNWKEWIAFCQQADLLIHDAQYFESDMPNKQGWGHSTALQVVTLAKNAGIKRLVTISHDPDRTDTELLQLEQSMQQKYQGQYHFNCAREGMVIELGAAHG